MGVETMMMAAAVASAAGTAVEGVDAFRQSRYQASVLNNQAEAARRDASIEAQLALEDGAREVGRGVTISAKSGGGLGGSAWDVLADLSRQNSYEVQRITTQGDNAGRAAEAEAKQVKQQGNFAAFSSVIKAGAQLAGAPTDGGRGTLLGDAMKRRAARGATARTVSSSARMPVTSWGQRDLVWSGGLG